MKLAIMQPYFLPYIGYWQLIHAVDRFVIYDDVNYIKNGWINRNRILINGEPTYITIPLIHASSFKRICDTSLQPTTIWRDKLVRMIETTYRKSPHFKEVFDVFEKLIYFDSDNLADYLAHQLQMLAKFMGINTEFVTTSRTYGNDALSGEARVLDICKRELAVTYVNPQGGLTLYDVETFRDAGIDLRFIVMQPIQYRQRTTGFVPYLSMIDALMEIGPVAIKHHLDSFVLTIGKSSYR